MKCGTTSLHEYLSYHPDIFMSPRKELNFFVEHQNWRRGLDWYKAHFVGATARVVGESSPNYTRHPLFPGVPKRMHALLPDAKLLYCVRDPIKRFLSHYTHSYSLGRENRALAEVVSNLDNTPYLLCSLYAYQLERYLEYYPAAQIKVVVLEALQRDPQGVLSDIFTSLGVADYRDPRFEKPSATMPPAAGRRRGPLKSWMVRRKLPGVYWLERNAPWVFGPPLKQPQLTPDLERTLTEAFAADTEKPARFLGHDLPWHSDAPEPLRRAG